VTFDPKKSLQLRIAWSRNRLFWRQLSLALVYLCSSQDFFWGRNKIMVVEDGKQQVLKPMDDDIFDRLAISNQFYV